MATETTKPSGPGKQDSPASRDAEKVEAYTPERIAEFLLNNAVNAADYAAALAEVRKMGLDPNTIPHEPPPGV
jgi:hypothetical protein